MLNVRIDEGGKALVAIQAAKAASGTIRIGEELQQAGGCRANACRGNYIAWKLLPWIEAGAVDTWRNKDRDQLACASIDKITEVAGFFLCRRDGGDVCVFIILLVPLLAVVAEGAVLPVVELRDAERTANCKSVVVLVICRHRIRPAPCRSVKEADGVEHAVSVDLEKIAVIMVGAGCH